MHRFAFVGLLSVLLVSSTGTAFAGGDSIGKSLGKLRWGMSQTEAVATLLEKIEESHAEDIRRTRMTPAETEVRRQMKAEISDLRSGHVMFNGSPTRWDGTFLEGEFTHNNNESMVTYQDGSSRNFYFFINGKLWKWIKAFDQPTFNGKSFNDFAKFVRGRFGSGSAKRGPRTPHGNAVQYLELSAGGTRLRAFDRLGGDRSFALVFEDKGTVSRLASLRTNRGRSNNRGDDRQVASRESRGSEQSAENTSSRFGDRRSINTHETQRQETEAEYRERARREREAARDHQRDEHARRQEAQRGRSLEGLAAIAEDDPLAGFGQ